MLKTFPVGGVHPPENKFSAGKAIETLPLPKTVTIPAGQHIGAPTQVLVKKGDTVKVGQIIAKASGFVSANIHSSVSGTVAKVDEIFDSSGYRKPSIVINVEGDEWMEDIDTSDTLIKDIKLSQNDIVKKVSEMGIVGLGGATFPTHVKLSIPDGKKAEYLIINAVECEPYLTADHQLMMEKGEEIMVGVSILMKAINVSKAIIGIENNKPNAIQHLTSLAGKYQGIKVEALKVQYPQGGEKQLIKALINREVPSGGLPLDVNCVVQNVGTAFAVYEAIQKNKPLIERIVSVTGKSVSKPSNFKARIGVSADMLIEAAGGLPSDTGKVVNGGPMMGKALGRTDVPVTKGTSGILIFKEEEASRKTIQPCIRCAKCVSVCPMGLEPYLLMTVAQKGNFERVETERAMDCIECGSCSYTCPSTRPLLDYIRLGKFEVGKMIRARNQR
ncbi:MAG: electron transport complex subunit RsxC [Bacteroidales bacterium]|nr:electron transport complex subunit RsxC [Bacteroidales bacterium]